MKRLLILVVAVAAMGAPSAALASGVVLKVQHTNNVVAVTRGGSNVALVHTSAAQRLHVGQRVAMTSHALRNGTFAATAVRVVGRAHTVRFRGLLLSKSRTRFVVSAGGAVIALNRGRTNAGANDSGPSPQPGSTVQVTATVGQGDELVDDDVTTVSAVTPGGQIEGTLTLGTSTVTVVSEHMALALIVPSGFDLSKFANGDEVLAKFTQGTDGTLTLVSLSGDESAQQADQGDDNNGSGGDDGDHQGGGGDSGSGGDD